MHRRMWLLSILIGSLVVTGNWEMTRAAGEEESEVRLAPGAKVGFSPEVVAGYIHAVIAADRALYTTHVVERMQENRIVISAEAPGNNGKRFLSPLKCSSWEGVPSR